MSTDALSSYEEVPYHGHPFVHTHPDRLATVATLLGMTPAPPGQCRVLELGCAEGANLLPMALTLPGSQFLGIDLSPRQIAEGNELVHALGLENIELRAQSILDLPDDAGPFDYILCHGVYSWVPPEVQDRILAICSFNLAPQGVAYVSYNTYPGWHLRAIVRDLLSFHVQPYAEPQAKLQQAHHLLDLLGEAVRDANSTYASVLEDELAELRPQADSYLFHEHLEAINRPVYFHEFAARAAEHGLQYLEEARFSPLPRSIPAKVRQGLEQLGADLIRREQYLDFLRGRPFRRSLLCHQDVSLRRPPSAEQVPALRATALAKPVTPQPDVLSTAVVEFRNPDGVSLSTNNPLIKAALCSLFAVWPSSLTFGELTARVGETLARSPELEAALEDRVALVLADALLQCFLANLVELHVHAPTFATEAGERPRASPLARLQATRNLAITNLRHHRTEVGPFDCAVLRHLDGTLDRAALLDRLAEAGAARELEAGANRELLGGELELSLQRLARSALLLA